MSEIENPDLTLSELAFEKLRDERNILLENSDKYVLSDYPHPSDSVKQAWLTYRQELRNLPETQNPSFNSDGELINITWPTKPNNLN